ncbi:MAG: hypothetical protein AAFR17_20055 [Pseudomonadota bacterium]
MIRCLRQGAAMLATTMAIGCAPALDPAGGGRVDDSYTIGGGFWNDGSILTVAAKAEQRDGRVALCGAWHVDQSSALTIGFHERVLSAGSLRLDGTLVAQNLLFLPQRGTLPDARTGCALSSTPWEPRFDRQPLQVRIPRQVFGGGIGSDEQRLVFRQGRPSFSAL